MQLKNDETGINALRKTILDYYENTGRVAKFFSESRSVEWEWVYLHFLVNRSQVIRYGIGMDRNKWLGGVELAIGPHYFGPAAFWSYEHSNRFRASADIDAVIHNLKLLDEFWEGHA